jgi:hypothetical protein
VDPRTDLDDVEKGKSLTLLGFELRLLGCPDRGQLLYIELLKRPPSEKLPKEWKMQEMNRNKPQSD